MSRSPGEKARLSSDNIRLFGDPVLREESKEITELGPELERLSKLMFEVMDREGGIGLAAPQIGIQRKIMVWRHPETEQGYVLLNPRIVERSEETVTASEGCLSLPGHSMDVERAICGVNRSRSKPQAYWRGSCSTRSITSRGTSSWTGRRPPSAAGC
jgi:peptide deformylase